MHIYQLSGRNVEVTDALREYVQEKLTRLDRYSDQITDARVVLTVRDVRDAGRRNRVEVQLNVPGGIVRAEEHHADMYAAIDRAIDRLEYQLKRYKERHFQRERQAVPEPVLAGGGFAEAEEDNEPRIVRTKRFNMKPMTPEDAAFEMEALGHDFFVFRNSDTEQINVIYRRRDGNYGLIEPSA